MTKERVVKTEEGICGAYVQGSTAFPSGVNRGAAFDTELEREIGCIVSRQEAAYGITQVLAPVLDIARDPRMGRQSEPYGEDPALAAAMGTAFIRGIQETETAGRHPESVAKHFLGFHSSQGGIHSAAVDAGERQIYEVYAKPFQAAIRGADLRGIMPCYCNVAGLPVHASKQYLTKMLREEMGFDGVVVSDYGATGMVFGVQHVGENMAEAGFLCMEAGMDTELPITICYGNMPHTPRYCFGHGLSYTSFAYSNIQLDKSGISSDEEIRISCTVKNTGSYSGTEIVQLYLQDVQASVTRPVKELQGFVRAALVPGEEKKVIFTVHPGLLAFMDKDMKWKIEKGSVHVQIGASSEDIRLEGEFEILDNRWIEGRERWLCARRTAMDMYGFYTGQILDAYEYLGAHLTSEGAVFRTFAPNVLRAGLLLAGKEIPMQPVYDGNFYEAAVPGVKAGALYEYRIYKPGGGYTDHCDPYGFGMELRPDHKSVVVNLWSYSFTDSKWMKQRTDRLDQPLNIYEMHLGSWRKPQSGEWYRYDELASLLIPYLKESGYNYVEFLPISEHPCDESWGYQNTGFYAPTSRYGTPDDLKKLIDLLHQSGIGVILDFVPVHFAIDEYALARYDGTALYEYPNRDVGTSEWGSYNFMHSRGEVRSFLQSAANFWLKEYHFDGLRMDAISRIIYWQGDEKRGVNGNAVDFIKVMNRGLKENNPGCILIAEDSTNYTGITKAVDDGGLGFDYKWDMGWMHDTLEFLQTAPEKRPDVYHKLTFSMMYFYNERYLLPFSHDEVVHGKATILQKMNGQYELKFPQARAMYLYMLVHPGKKLNFMGNEIGQLREWSEKQQQDWNLRKYPIHDSFYHFMIELNKIYLKHSSLYEMDYERNGFTWLDCHQEQKCVYVLERMSKDEKLIAVFNFSNKWQNCSLSETNAAKIIIHTD